MNTISRFNSLDEVGGQDQAGQRGQPLSRRLGARSLVLVDELASGTDPVEGSALAQALLSRLAQLARLTIVTTHYPELKEWASATDGAANAATGLDPETHEPLYRVALGRPGWA